MSKGHAVNQEAPGTPALSLSLISFTRFRFLLFLRRCYVDRHLADEPGLAVVSVCDM